VEIFILFELCAKYAKDYCTLGFSCPRFGQIGQECGNKMGGLLQCQKNEHHRNKMVAHLQRVCHIVALPFTFFKKNLKAKEKL
jgi:hypothetical protein